MMSAKFQFLSNFHKIPRVAEMEETGHESFPKLRKLGSTSEPL